MATYYKVIGNGNPSPNGYYRDAGFYGFWRYYTREDGAFTIWNEAPFPVFIISIGVAVLVNYWGKGQPILGTYAPIGVNTGNPVVVRAAPVGTMRMMGVGR